MKIKKNRLIAVLSAGVGLILLLAASALLLPIILGWADSPTIRIPNLDDLEYIDARAIDPRGMPIADEFELPRRFNGDVRDFFLVRSWRWGRPDIPDHARVAQLRFRSGGNRSLNIDVYDVGKGRIGVGTSGGRLLFDTPGKGAAELLGVLERAKKWEGIPEVTEIALERSMCLGDCPVDTVVFRSDGTADYHGGSHVDRLGRYTGSITSGDFRRLAKLVDDNGFAGMNGRYDKMVTDVATHTTIVRWGPRMRKTENHGNAGPAPLREIEAAIIALVRRIAWKVDP